MRTGVVIAGALAVACASGCGAKQTAQSAGSGLVRFHDREVGLSGEYPAGWDRARAVGNLVLPREVLALASYPLRAGSKGGGCAPKNVLEDMPLEGAFIWIQEYRHRAGGRLGRSSEEPLPAQA